MTWLQGGAIDLGKLRRRYGFACLVRPHVGLMEGVTFLAQEPGSPLLEIASTTLGNLSLTFRRVTSREGREAADRVIGGAGSDLDPESAWVKAVVEGAERYASMAFCEEDFVVATAHELDDRAVNLATIPRCSEREYADPRCPLSPARLDQPIRWVCGYSLVSRRVVLLPAIMTHLYLTPWPSERFWLPISTGTAAHTDLSAALESAIYESIERDAIALTWLARLPLRRIERPTPPPAALKPLLSRLDASQVEQLFFDATTDLGVPTVFSVQLYGGHPTCSLFVSCSTNPDPVTAYAKAICEAVPARNVMSIRRFIPEDVADFCDLTHGADYYGRRGPGKDFDFLLRGKESTSLEEMKRYAMADVLAGNRLNRLLSILRERGWEAVAVDLTSDELREAGLWVVRVVVPQAMPISFVHRARYLGTPRLYEYPASVGAGYLAEEDLNPGPMSFA